tara:strand:+ start:38 stop:388 length:351 start_codon:yes stop_codon:yes gene_type:complete
MLDDKKFISDENIPIKVTNSLREKGYDVKKAPVGHTDKQISKISKEESRIILTFDKHFLNKKNFPPKEHLGIIFISIHPPKEDTVFYSIMRLLKDSKFLELQGKLIVITIFGHREK